MSKGKFGKLKVKNKNGHVWMCECMCGNIVFLTKEEIINGCDCGQACLSSRGEICAADLFNELGVKYQVQKKFKDFNLRFDFYLPDYNVIIECDGAQHFRSINNDWDSSFKLQETRNHDKQKIEYCKKKNIILFQIPFWDKKRLNKKYLQEALDEINHQCNSNNASSFDSR